MAGLTGDLTKIEVGAHIVSYGASGSQVNLGFTIEGSEITYTPEYVDVMVDQLGKTIVKKFLIGEDVKAKLTLQEVKVANLLVALTGASAAATGLDIGRRAAFDVSTGASGILTLHPVELDAGDLTRDWTLPIAVQQGAVTIPYKMDAQTLIPIEFQAIANPASDNPKHLARWGY